MNRCKMDIRGEILKAKQLKGILRDIIENEIPAALEEMQYFIRKLNNHQNPNYENKENQEEVFLRSFIDRWNHNKDIIRILWKYLGNETEIKSFLHQENELVVHSAAEIQPNSLGNPLLSETFIPLDNPSEPNDEDEMRLHFIKYCFLLLNKVVEILSPSLDDAQGYKPLKIFISSWREYSVLIYLVWKNVFICQSTVLNLASKTIYWKAPVHRDSTETPHTKATIEPQGEFSKRETTIKVYSTAKDSQPTQYDNLCSSCRLTRSPCSTSPDTEVYRELPGTCKNLAERTEEDSDTNAQPGEETLKDTQQHIGAVESHTYDKLMQEKCRLENETKEAQPKILNLKTELEKAKHDQRDIEKSNIFNHKRACDLENKLKSLQNEHDKLSQKHERLKKEKAEVTAKWKETHDKTVKQSDAEIGTSQNIRRQLQEKEKQIVQLEKEMTSNASTVSKMEQDAKEFQLANSTLVQESERIQAEHRHLHEQNKKLHTANKELEERHEREIERLTEENRQYTKRLAEQMNNDLARNETDLEDISQAVSPTKLKDEYESICRNQWLEAKTVLDGYAKKLMNYYTEEGLCTVMVDIIRACESFANDLYHELIKLFEEYISSPIHPHVLKKVQHSFLKWVSWKDVKSPEASKLMHCQLDENFKIQLCNFLKRSSTSITWTEIVIELLINELEEHFKGDDPEFLQTNHALREYVRALLALSWKMVLQQPPMLFKYALADVNGLFDSSRHVPHFRSADPNEEGVTIRYFVHPAMWHGEKQIIKARVFLERAEEAVAGGNTLSNQNAAAQSSHLQRS